MYPFSTPNPTTYAALLDILRNETLPYPIVPLDLDRIDHIASRMAHLRAYASDRVNCYSCGNKVPQTMLMEYLIDELERLGVRGWIEAFDERPMLAKLRLEVEELEDKESELLAEMEALKAEIKSLRPTGAPTNAPPAAGLQQQQGMLQHEEGDVERLQGLTERLEKLVDSKEAGAGGLGETRVGRASSIHEDVQLSDDESERHDRAARNTQLGMEHGRPNRKPRPFSESSVDVEVGSSYIHSPTTSVTGTGLSSNSEYPPPLRRSTEYEKEDDDKNAKLLEEENTLWVNEQEELHQSLTPDNPPMSQNPQPLSLSGIDSAPSYIYIPLPANFTLPQHNAHLPSLTFKTPPSVFHFPQGAKKDQLLFVLRQRCATGLPIPHLEPLEGINVMQVRTHHMEWELKNAIRKSMTQEQWESKVGNQWYTEGQGDTYIVSRTDVYFHGVSGSATDKRGEGRANDKSRICMSNESENEDDGHAIPRLRGGASSYSLEDRERRSFAALSSGSWDFDIPDDYREVLDDIDEAGKRGFQKAYIEYARILQLQNASQDRMIERLQDIIEDMEKTFDWQDNVLDTMHHRIEHCKHEAKTAADEATRAWKEVDAAKAETEELKALLNDINEQVGSFYEQLEQNLEHISMYGDAEEWGGSKLPEIRGGGDSSRQRPSSPSPKTAIEHGDSSTRDIDATAFYFFPSVSIMVLLTNPLRYFQWPRHTTLAQARDILEHRHVHGLENNPHLRHICKIMETREEMGFSLPDTTDGRQVLITLPATENDFVSENTGRGSKWEQSFRPDEYRQVLREQLSNLDIPVGNDGDDQSSRSGGDDESYDDAGDFINAINELNADTILTSTCDIWGGNKDPSPPFVNTGMQNPYADSMTGVRGGNSHSTPPPSAMPSSVLYPPVINKRPNLTRKRTKVIVPERSEHPHPARMPEDRMWKVVRYPYEEVGDELYEECEIDRSANFDYELGIGGQSPPKQSNEKEEGKDGGGEQDAEDDGDAKKVDVEVDDAEWEMWRHRKGEGCESWLDQSMLDPERTACTFCYLPWAENPYRKWEFAIERRPRSAMVRTPVNTNRRSSPKRAAPIPPSPSAYLDINLRGGADAELADYVPSLSARHDSHSSDGSTPSPSNNLTRSTPILDPHNEDAKVQSNFGCHEYPKSARDSPYRVMACPGPVATGGFLGGHDETERRPRTADAEYSSEGSIAPLDSPLPSYLNRPSDSGTKLFSESKANKVVRCRHESPISNNPSNTSEDRGRQHQTTMQSTASRDPSDPVAEIASLCAHLEETNAQLFFLNFMEDRESARSRHSTLVSEVLQPRASRTPTFATESVHNELRSSRRDEIHTHFPLVSHKGNVGKAEFDTERMFREWECKALSEASKDEREGDDAKDL